MLTPLDLSIRDLKRFAIIVHGEYGSGKTYLAGDMLVYEKEFGPIGYLNIKGEEGNRSIAHLGLNLGNCYGATAETFDDINEYLQNCAQKKVHAIAVDTLRELYNCVMRKIVGADRLPDAQSPQKGGDGDRSRAMWGQARYQTEQLLGKMHYAADIVLVTCPSAKNENEITGERRVTPDIYGAMAQAAVGKFDFGGYLDPPVIMGPGKVTRKISFQKRGDTQTRQRLPAPMDESLVLPNGPGGWKIIKEALEKGMGNPPQEVKK